MSKKRPPSRIFARLYQRIAGLGITFLAFGGVFFFLLYFLLNSSFPPKILDLALTPLFHGQIGFERITFGPWPWQIRVLNFHILDPEQNAAIAAEAVHIDHYDYLGLLVFDVHIPGIRLDKAAIHLKGTADPDAYDDLGHHRIAINIERAFWPTSPTPDDGEPLTTAPTLNFTDITLTNTEFSIEMPGVMVSVLDINGQGIRYGMDIKSPNTSMAIGAETLTTGEVTVLVDLQAEDALASPLQKIAVRAKKFVQPAPMMTELYLPFSDVKVQNFDWKGMSFDISEISLLAREDPITVRQFGMDLDVAGLPELRAKVEAEIGELNEHLAPINLDQVFGAVTLDADISGELSALEGTFGVSGEDIVAFGFPVRRLELQGQKSILNKFELTQFTTEVLRGALNGTASFDLYTGSAVVDMDYRRLDLASLPFTLPKEVQALAEGPIEGLVRARGLRVLDDDREITLESFGELERKGQKSLYALGKNVRFELGAHGEGLAFTLDHFKFLAGPYKIRSNGLADLEASLLKNSTTGVQFSLGPLLESLGVNDAKGEVALKLTTSGELTSPKVHAQISASGLKFQDLPTGSLRSEIDMDSGTGRLKVDYLRLNIANGQIGVKGKIDLYNDRLPLNFTVSIKDLDLSTLPYGARGILNAQFAITGSATSPNVEIESMTIDKPGYDVLEFDQIAINGRFKNNQAELDQLNVNYQGRPIVTVQGKYALKSEKFDASIFLNEIPLSIARAFVPDLPLEGSVSFNLQAEGDLKHNTAQGNLALRDIAYDTFKLGNSDFELNVEDSRLEVEGDIFQALKLAAQLPIHPSIKEKANAKISFNSLHVEDYLESLKNSLTTNISGSVSASADIFNGDIQAVNLELTTLEAETSGIKVFAAQPLRAHLNSAFATLEPLHLVQDESELELEGKFNLKTQNINAHIKGDLNFASLTPFIESVFTKIEGLAELDISVEGPASDPHPTGFVRLNSFDARPRMSMVGRELHLVRPTEIEITVPQKPKKTGMFDIGLASKLNGKSKNHFILRRDEGQIEITKLDAHFSEFVPTQIALNLNAAEQSVNVPQMLRATVTASDLSVELNQITLPDQTTDYRMKVGGDIDILSGAYTGDILAGSDISQGVRDSLGGRTKLSSVSAFETVPLLRRLFLDVRVHGDGDFFIQNQITAMTLNLEVREDVRAKGYLTSEPNDRDSDKLTITGTVDILDDSTVTYARRAFEVTEGTILLGGSNFMSATVEATHTFQLRSDQGPSSGTFDKGASNVKLEEVILNASVTLATLQSSPEIDLTFTSSSGASQLEVITLVLTGSFPSDLSGSQSAQPATEMLLAPILDLIERPLEETLDIDLTLTPSADGSLFISADKSLSRRLRAYARSSLGDVEDDSNPPTFGLEYRLNNLLSSELINEQASGLNTTSARLRLRWMLD